MRESAVMISSTMPSAKYSCSGSPLILAKGSTAIDGLSGSSADAGQLPPRGSGRRRRRVGEVTHAVDPHWPRDVLELLLADVFEGEVEPARGILLHARRDADPAGLGQRFEPGRDVDAVAKDVAVLDDDVADIDADTELDAGRRPARRHCARPSPLHFDGAAQRIDDAAELDEQPVTGGLDEAAVVLGDFRIEQLAPQRPERLEGAALVRADQPRIARHIGGKDRGKTAGGGHD